MSGTHKIVKEIHKSRKQTHECLVMLTTGVHYLVPGDYYRYRMYM